MIRKTLALLIRALRVDARSLRPHLIRLGLLAVILWLLYIAESWSGNSGSPGLTLFYSLAQTNIWFITIVGITYFASAITEEKEERTLGLLRMADIGAASILLGKWLPRVLGMLSLIVVQFPFTLLAITLGGVTQDQVNAVYVALLLHLLSIGTYSLLASVYCRNTASACRLTFIMVFLRWLLPTLATALSSFGGLQGTTRQLVDGISMASQASVSALTSRALATTFTGTPFPPAALWWMAEIAAVFFLAWLLFEPCTQGENVNEAAPSRLTTLFSRKSRSSHRRAWDSPLVGKDFLLLAGGPRGTLLRFALYMAIAVGWLFLMSFGRGASINVEELGGTLFGFGIGFLILEVIQSAAKVFRVELQEQTWSALMMLPQGLNGLAWAKIAGCALGWWPALTMIFVGGLMIPSGISSMLEGIFDPDVFFVFAYFAMQIFLIAELTVLVSISLTWAAWPLAAPLAFFIILITNVLVFTCFVSAMIGGGGDGAQVIFFLLTGISAIVAAVLYRRIGVVLVNKASDGT